MSKYYDVCARSIGRPVVVRTVDGRVHRGRIARVTRSHLFLAPIGSAVSTQDADWQVALAVSEGTSDQTLGKEITWGWGWGGWGAGAGFVTGLAFGAIATLAFLPWFWI